MSEQRTEIFIERFVVAQSRNGAGFIEHVYPTRVTFTQDLRKAARFDTHEAVRNALYQKEAKDKPVGERDPRNYRCTAAYAQVGLGQPPKAAKP